MRSLTCYHDWVQAALLFVIYIFLFAILFLGVAMQAYLEHLRNKVYILFGYGPEKDERSYEERLDEPYRRFESKRLIFDRHTQKGLY